MKSSRDGRSLQLFQIELMVLSMPRQLFQITLHAHKQGLFLRWKSLVLPFRSDSVITAKFSDTRPKIVRQKLNMSSVEKATHTKDAQTEKNQPKCAKCKRPHVANYKGCPAYKKRFSVNMWSTNKKLCLHFKTNFASPPLPLVKFVATVDIQITQPQMCYSNAPKDAVDKKSSLCLRVSEAAKSQLGISQYLWKYLV